MIEIPLARFHSHRRSLEVNSDSSIASVTGTSFSKNTNKIWKAAKYLQPDGTGGFHRLPGLTVGARLVEDYSHISQHLLNEFFDDCVNSVRAR